MHEANLYNIFLSRLNQAGFDYMVTGSVACIIYGQPRMTHDIDIILDVRTSQIDELINVFPVKEFYCPPSNIIQIENDREARGHFNLIHQDSGFKADIYPVGNDNLIRWGLSCKKKFQMQEQVVWVAPPEYVIIQKIQYYLEGGSSKHLSDIRGVLNTSSEMIDFSSLEEWIEKLSLQGEWELING